MRAPTPRWRSVRIRAALVVLAVAIAPPLLVWGSAATDRTEGRRMRLRVRQVAQDAVEAGGDTVALEGLARRHGVRIRLIDPQRQVRLDLDHEAPSALNQIAGTVFFGPGGAPTLAEWEASHPPLAQRADVALALNGGATDRCEVSDELTLLVCTASLPAPGGAVVVQESSRRAIRALHDLRYPMLKLSLMVVLVGLGLAAWLGWRLVRPLERLRDQVADRTARRSLEPVTLDRDDEFGDLAEAFNALLSSLAARDKANEAFAADLVHEIKNPVAAVRTAAEALGSGRPIDPERAARLARILEDSGSRLDALASRFLDLARAEAGLAMEAREPVDVSEIARVMVDAARADARWAGVEISTELAPTRIEGIPERLETVLRNLLDNALRHARLGEGHRVRVVVQPGLLEVHDSGPGVPEGERERIFERFVSRRPGGTGLGLAMTRAIVHAHGGEIQVGASALGGAVFRVRLNR